MSDLESFLVAIIDRRDLDAAGPLADWLDEHGDPRGVLLRRRWKRWVTERAKGLAEIERERAALEAPWRKVIDDIGAIPGMTVGSASVSVTVSDYAVQRLDAGFRDYVWRKFAPRDRGVHLAGE